MVDAATLMGLDTADMVGICSHVALAEDCSRSRQRSEGTSLFSLANTISELDLDSALQRDLRSVACDTCSPVVDSLIVESSDIWTPASHTHFAMLPSKMTSSQ